VKEINLNDQDRFYINGVDDDCFMIVNQIIINNDVNIPVVLKGKVYQVDTEENRINKLGDNYNIQISLTVDAIWKDD
jgi:alanine dehydrogenase